jgi:membrane fusion protein (multidrug efflux system)
MKKRMFFMLVIVAGFLAILGTVKYRQISAAIAQGKAWAPPPEAVTTVVAKGEKWRDVTGAVGTMTAVNGVTLAADLPGIVSQISFESGQWVNEGDVILRLDTKQESAQLLAAEAKSELDRANFERAKMLLEQKVISQADYDAAVSAYDQSRAVVVTAQATIARKTILAPFSGVLGIRQVNRGQYLNSGSPIVSLQSFDPIYVNFGVPQQEMATMAPGTEITITSDALPGETFTGKISAVNSVIDENTRNAWVQATLRNPKGRLKPGMYVRTQVAMAQEQDVVPLPVSSISYAPYGDSVFIVDDMKGPDGGTYKGVRQQFVKTGGARGDQVAVLSGVKPGEEVVTSGVFKLRNGASVLVNNEVTPSNQAAPKVEDN